MLPDFSTKMYDRNGGIATGEKSLGASARSHWATMTPKTHSALQHD
jgi:hypothetical protein